MDQHQDFEDDVVKEGETQNSIKETRGETIKNLGVKQTASGHAIRESCSHTAKTP